MTVLIGLFFASLLAGILNIMAGGGSFMMLPLLIFSGLPATVANGTNRIALLVQNSAGVAGFIKKDVFDFRTSVKLAVPAVIASIAGAYSSVRIPDALFQKTISVLMLLFVIYMVFSSNNKKNSEKRKTPGKLTTFIIFFLVGLYGGFIQAGVGLFLIGSVKLCTGLDLVRTNAIKTFIIACYTIVAIVVFAVAGKINWTVALVVSVGQGLGGYIGSMVTVKGGEKIVKAFIVIALVLMAIKLFIS